MTAAARTVPAGRVVLAIARREAVATVGGMGLYVACAVAALAAAWLLVVDVRALQVAGLLVHADPFGAPLDAALLVLAVFLAVTAAVQTARDRQSGTLEVLFYAPVDEATYVLGKMLGMMAGYAVSLPLVLASFAAMSAVSGFLLPPTLPVALLLATGPMAMVVALGILLAVGTDRVRTAVLLLGAVAAAFLGATAAYGIVLMIPIDTPSSPVIPLRDALAAATGALRWISPFAYLQRIVAEGTAIGAWRTVAVNLALTAGWTLVLLAAAAAWLRRRGCAGSEE